MENLGEGAEEGERRKEEGESVVLFILLFEKEEGERRKEEGGRRKEEVWYYSSCAPFRRLVEETRSRMSSVQSDWSVCVDSESGKRFDSISNSSQ